MIKKIRNKTKDIKYPKGKPTVDYAVGFLEIRLNQLKSDYEKLSKDYAHCVNIGVGLTAINIIETLHNLAFLYTDITAHEDALRSLKVIY